jgi:hypothetical protein
MRTLSIHVLRLSIHVLRLTRLILYFHVPRISSQVLLDSLVKSDFFTVLVPLLIEEVSFIFKIINLVITVLNIVVIIGVVNGTIAHSFLDIFPTPIIQHPLLCNLFVVISVIVVALLPLTNLKSVFKTVFPSFPF